MTFEDLCKGNSLNKQAIDVKNEITQLEKWLDELKNDETVMISSYEEPQEKFVVELHGTRVIPFVEERLEYLKNHLNELNKEFEKL